MNLTETEAKTKWCPFSRTGAYADNGPTATSLGRFMAVTTNRDPRPNVQSSCNCIASECMAWKWGEFYTNYTSQGISYHVSPSGEIGYCGLMK